MGLRKPGYIYFMCSSVPQNKKKTNKKKILIKYVSVGRGEFFVGNNGINLFFPSAVQCITLILLRPIQDVVFAITLKCQCVLNIIHCFIHNCTLILVVYGFFIHFPGCSNNILRLEGRVGI